MVGSDDWESQYKAWKEAKRRKEEEEQSPPKFSEPVKEEVKVEKEVVVSKPKTKRVERIIIVTVYVVVLGFAAYLIMASLFPDKLPFKATGYVITADDSKLFNPLSSFYIDDPSSLGDKILLNGKVVRPIIPPKKFNFVFVPKTSIPDGTKATLSLNLMFNNSNATDVYLNDKLIFPSLANYVLISESDKDYIYVNKDILPYINNSITSTTDDAEKFIYEYFPGASVWSDHQLEPLNVKLDDYKSQVTFINGTFRDNLKLAVYVGGDLNISFVKQDLNMYVGPDEYTINVKDYKGNVVYTGLVGDDGVKTTGSKGKEQPYSFSVKGIPEGIYYISFTKDAYNDYSDSSVKNIKVDTNKVIIVGNFLPWAPFSFYTKTSFPKSIGFYYWLKGKNQVINVKGVNATDVDLDASWIGKRYNENITYGDYNFVIEKGYVWVYSDYASPSQTGYFNLPIAQQYKFNSPNVLVIEKEGFDNKINEFNYSGDMTLNNKASKIGFRVLDSDSVYLESAELSD